MPQKYLGTPSDNQETSNYKNGRTANLVFTETMEELLANHIKDVDRWY